MSNYYTGAIFHETIECRNKAEVTWLRQNLKGCGGQVTTGDFWVEIASINTLDANMNMIADVIAEYQRIFKVKSPWIGSFCCLSFDDIGGKSCAAAVLIYRGGIHTINATDLALAKGSALVKAKPKGKVKVKGTQTKNKPA